MRPRNLRVEERPKARTLYALGRIAFAALLILGLAGCASDLAQRPTRSPMNAAPYVGVFTGEFVDGKPLYRFPPIEVIGSRSSLGPGG